MDTRAQPFHSVHFYEREDHLNGVVANFFGEGLVTGAPILAIAARDHRAAFAGQLQKDGVEVARLTASGEITFLDPHEVLATFMSGKVPDRQRFRASVGGIFQKIGQDRSTPGVRAYGEMVDVVWNERGVHAALEIEDLWNDLLSAHEFSLLCAYSRAGVAGAANPAEVEEICRRHTIVEGRFRDATSQREFPPLRPVGDDVSTMVMRLYAEPDSASCRALRELLGADTASGAVLRIEFAAEEEKSRLTASVERIFKEHSSRQRK